MVFSVQTFVGTFVAAALLGAAPAAATEAEDASGSDLAALREEIEALKRDHAERLRALEERVAEAERRASEAEVAAAQAEAAVAERGAEDPDAAAGGIAGRVSDGWASLSRAFNPQISAILQGRVAYLEGGDGARNLPGFALGGQHDRGEEGIALGESELIFSANVDDALYGFMNVAFDQDEIELEEAFLETTSLPWGLRVKGGQFFSAVGYHNERHAHTWDFVDAPLAYEGILDGRLADAGVQLSWVAPTDLYLELGSEILRGDGFPAAGARNSGFGSGSAFAKLGGDVGDSHSWQLGGSYVWAESHGRESVAADGSDVAFDGSTDVAVADLVWKWAPGGNRRERNLTFQTEYLYRSDRGTAFTDVGAGRIRSSNHGFYAQGIYQFMPRWRVGVRYGQLWGDHATAGLAPGFLVSDHRSPRRVSAMIDYSHSEFSRLRLQYSHESGGLGSDSLLYLQYIISIGAHGAHEF